MTCRRTGGLDIFCERWWCLYHLADTWFHVSEVARPADLPTCALAVAATGEHSTAEVARLLGCTRQRVDQICKEALRKARHRLAEFGVTDLRGWAELDREQAIGVEPIDYGTVTELERGLAGKRYTDVSWYGRRKASSAAHKRRQGGKVA